MMIPPTPKGVAMLTDRFPILKRFTYKHLEEHAPQLAAVSKPFCELAYKMAEECPEGRDAGIETSAGLRKLMEAKDCAVRAHVEA